MNTVSPVEDVASSVYSAVYSDLPDVEYAKYQWIMTGDPPVRERVQDGTAFRRPYVTEVEVYSFPQTWGSTALGFDGIGGSALTTATTVVVIHERHAAVYFGGRHAYTVPLTQRLMERVRSHDMPPVSRVGSLRDEETQP